MAISQYPAGSQGSYRRNRNCLPEIATAPSGPRNDNSGVFTILTGAFAGRQYRAGRGVPRPYKAYVLDENAQKFVTAKGAH